MLEITYTLPPVIEEVEEPPTAPTGSAGESSWHRELDDMLEKLEVESDVEDQEPAQPESSLPSRDPPQVRIIRQETKDIAMPDRYVLSSHLS